MQKSKWSTGNSFSNVGKVLSSTLLFFLPLFLRAKEGKRQITLLCFACINSWNCWGGMTRVIYTLALLLMFRFLSWQNSILKIASPGSKVLSVPAFSSSWRSLWFHRFTLWTWTCFLSSAQAHTPSEVAPAASRSPVASRSLLWRRFDGGGEATYFDVGLWRGALTRVWRRWRSNPLRVWAWVKQQICFTSKAIVRMKRLIFITNATNPETSSASSSSSVSLSLQANQ